MFCSLHARSSLHIPPHSLFLSIYFPTPLCYWFCMLQSPFAMCQCNYTFLSLHCLLPMLLSHNSSPFTGVSGTHCPPILSVSWESLSEHQHFINLFLLVRKRQFKRVQLEVVETAIPDNQMPGDSYSLPKVSRFLPTDALRIPSSIPKFRCGIQK